MKKIINMLNGLINNIVDYFVYDNYEEDKDYIVFNTDIIDSSVRKVYDELSLTEKSLKNDYEYSVLESEEDKEKYIEKNIDDRFYEISQEHRKYVYDGIINIMRQDCYDTFEGEFFTCRSGFKNLHPSQIAFVENNEPLNEIKKKIGFLIKHTEEHAPEIRSLFEKMEALQKEVYNVSCFEAKLNYPINLKYDIIRGALNTYTSYDLLKEDIEKIKEKSCARICDKLIDIELNLDIQDFSDIDEVLDAFKDAYKAL